MLMLLISFIRDRSLPSLLICFSCRKMHFLSCIFNFNKCQQLHLIFISPHTTAAHHSSTPRAAHHTRPETQHTVQAALWYPEDLVCFFFLGQHTTEIIWTTNCLSLDPKDFSSKPQKIILTTNCLSLVKFTNALQTVLTAAEYSILRFY